MKNKLKVAVLLLAMLANIQPAAATYVPPNPNGQATMANSGPVAVASDQASIPVINGIVQAISAGQARTSGTTPTYAAGQLVANSATAGSVTTPTISVARANNVGGGLVGIQLIKTSNSLVNAIFDVEFYSTAPIYSNGDAAAWLTPKAGYLGCFHVTMTHVFSDPAAEGEGVPCAGNMLPFIPVSGAQTLYWVVVAQAQYVGVSAETFSLNAYVN